jgi:hypothetical protein
MNDAAKPGGDLPSEPSVDWEELLERIRSGDESARHDVFELFSKGVRLYLKRCVGATRVEAAHGAVFRAIFEAVIRGEPRNPQRFPGVVWILARRQVRQEQHNRSDPPAGSEPGEIQAHDARHAADALRPLAARHREALLRFYVEREPEEQVCAELGLSPAEFREVRALARRRLAGVSGRVR